MGRGRRLCFLQHWLRAVRQPLEFTELGSHPLPCRGQQGSAAPSPPSPVCSGKRCPYPPLETPVAPFCLMALLADQSCGATAEAGRIKRYRCRVWFYLQRRLGFYASLLLPSWKHLRKQPLWGARPYNIKAAFKSPFRRDQQHLATASLACAVRGGGIQWP